MQKVVAELERDNKGVRFEVQTGGSSRGATDTIEDRNDVGMMSRDPTKDELSKLYAHPIAFDGISLIVNKGNPITSIKHAQVVELFTKKTTKWSGVSKHKGDVFVISKAEGRATLDVFLKHFDLTAQKVKPDAVIGDNQQGLRMVAGNPQAIGFVSVGEALRAVKDGVKIKLVALDGVSPTTSNIADGSYPLSRRLYLVFREQPKEGWGRVILDFVASDRGKAIVKDLNFVPLAAK